MTQESHAGHKIFWLLLVAGATARFLNLGLSSYMLDEATLLRGAIEADSVSAAYAAALESWSWPQRLPLLSACLNALLGLGGLPASLPDEWLARLPSAVLGVATLPLVYGLGCRVGDRVSGQWLMFLMTISVFHVYYSRVLDVYAALIFCSTGVLWTSLELLRKWRTSSSVHVWYALAYICFSTVLLQSHASGFLFLLSWNLVMLRSLWRDPSSRPAFKGRKLLAWLGTFAVAYIGFLPFIMNMLRGSSEAAPATGGVFALGWLLRLFAQMGWGAAWFTLLPFAAVVVMGVVSVLRDRQEAAYAAVRMVLLQFAVAFLLITLVRFRRGVNTQSFCTLFPIILLLASIGIRALLASAAAKWRACPMPVGMAVVALALACWHAPSLQALAKLECHGVNYRAIADWANKELPENGIYGYWNVYDLRGTPGMYPTDNRFPSYPLPWSSADDYAKYQVQKRLISFYRRFPLAHFVEIMPTDQFAPELVENEPVPRDLLFMNQSWIEAEHYQKLIKLRTWPVGDGQWSMAFADRVLVSYNTKEDLAKMAAKRGEKLYQYFGPEWRYAKDQQMNDWRIATRSARVIIGNTDSTSVPANIRISCMAPPNGCKLSMYAPNGAQVADNVEIPATSYELQIPTVGLAPGENTLFMDVLPMPNELEGQLLVYGVLAQEAVPPPAAAPASVEQTLPEAAESAAQDMDSTQP